MARLYGKMENEHRDIILSFDDGPNAKTTGPLLDTLDDYGVRAMFFVVGRRLQSRVGRNTVARAYERGHVIGNHTFSHPNLRKLSLEEIRDEIGKTHDLIVEITGTCQYFRSPYGSSNLDVDQVIDELDYRTVMWTVDPEDWRAERKSEGVWVDFAMDGIKKREDSLVLMHDIHKSTVEHVGTLIERIVKLKRIRFTTY